MSIRTYSELITLRTFEERYRYLRLDGTVGAETFGWDRFLNQTFYKSEEWKTFRRDIIVRDMGCDLGVAGFDINAKIIIHHLEPITIADIRNRRLEVLLNPENAICTSHNTHQAIHYGDESLLVTAPIVRTKNDTCPWRQN